MTFLVLRRLIQSSFLAARRIRLNTRRKNVNAIVITLSRSALVMTHNIEFGACDGETLRPPSDFISPRASRARDKATRGANRPRTIDRVSLIDNLSASRRGRWWEVRPKIASGDATRSCFLG